MNYIIEIDGVVSTRYRYNVWSVYTFHETAMVPDSYLKDTRIFCSDNEQEFLSFIKNGMKEVNGEVTIEDFTPEGYASFWGCDPCYDKPPRLQGDGCLFYNFGSEPKTKENLTKFLPAIDRTIEAENRREVAKDSIAQEHKEKNIQSLTELKNYVQSLLNKILESEAKRERHQPSH